MVAELASALGIGQVAAACLVNRGLSAADEARAFLEPRLADLRVPHGMVDLKKAAERTAEAIIKRERIGVFGDYDVDGISSAALVTLCLRAAGASPEVLFADRFCGYGMGVGAVDRFAERDCSLIVSVDCGTSDHAAADRAAEIGLDMIVLDHHRVEGQHPDVLAFVNPERSDCDFGDKTLAAVGIAFYFAAETRSALTRRGEIRRDDMDVRAWLDLVALGTVADVVPLRGNNRILVRHGLQSMSRSPREGLRCLARLSRIRSSQIRADHIAYQLAPRLNAAGRLSRAEESFELLVANDRVEAEPLASRLDALSQQRRTLEEEVIEAARARIEKDGLDKEQVIVVGGDGWHRGVLGIVAARLVEGFGKPAFVIGFDDDVGTGSARAKGEINLHQSLAAATDYLVRFGGHRDAAGFTVQKDEVEHLRRTLIDYAAANTIETSGLATLCDATLKPSELTASLLREISRLGPFGAGNEEPIFDIDGLYVLKKRVVGHDHLKLELKTPSGTIAAFGPRMADHLEKIPALIRVAANLILDEWRGNGIPELRLVAPPVPGR